MIALFGLAGSGDIIAGPDIISRGFVYVKEAEEIFEEMKEQVDEILDTIYENGISDRNKMKFMIRDGLADFLWKKMKRRPVIMPVFMEV